MLSGNDTVARAIDERRRKLYFDLGANGVK
jgi:hypothetical protein